MKKMISGEAYYNYDGEWMTKAEIEQRKKKDALKKMSKKPVKWLSEEKMKEFRKGMKKK